MTLLLNTFLLAAESGTLGKGVIFWILFLVALVFGFVGYAYRDSPYIAHIGGWFILAELFLLGWAVFGFPIG